MKRTQTFDDAELMERVERDFGIFQDSFFGIVLFGSYARGNPAPTSDIDVCIITNDSRKNSKSILYNEIYPNIKMDIYDVVIFEDCNDELKSEIAKNYRILYSRDKKTIEDYLEPFKYMVFEKIPLADIIAKIKGVVCE